MCHWCAATQQRCLSMARKVGQIVGRGPRTRLVRVYNGRREGRRQTECVGVPPKRAGKAASASGVRDALHQAAADKVATSPASDRTPSAAPTSRGDRKSAAARSRRRRSRATAFEIGETLRLFPLFRYQRVMPDSTPRSFNHRLLVSLIRQICVFQDNYLEVRRQFRTHREQ